MVDLGRLLGRFGRGDGRFHGRGLGVSQLGVGIGGFVADEECDDVGQMVRKIGYCGDGGAEGTSGTGAHRP